MLRNPFRGKARAAKAAAAAALLNDRVNLLFMDGGSTYYVSRNDMLDTFNPTHRSIPVWGRRRWIGATVGGAFVFTAAYAGFFTGMHWPAMWSGMVAMFLSSAGAAIGAWRMPLPEGEWTLRRRDFEIPIVDGATEEDLAKRENAIKILMNNAKREGHLAGLTLKGCSVIESIPPDSAILSDTYDYFDPDLKQSITQTVTYIAPGYTRELEKMQDEKEAMAGPKKEVGKIQLGIQALMVCVIYGGIIFYAMATNGTTEPQSSPQVQQQQEQSPFVAPVASALPGAGQPFTRGQAAALLSLGDASLKDRGFTDDQLVIMRDVVFNNAAIPPKYEVP